MKKANSFIGLVLLGVLLLVLWGVSRHPWAEQIRRAFTQRVGAVLHNLFGEVGISRRKPLTTIDLEENLKHNLPVPFARFTTEEWRWFWHLLYGRIQSQGSGWLARKRQLTREEVQEELAYYYEQPFAYFNQTQWAIFWQQVLKGKVFK